MTLLTAVDVGAQSSTAVRRSQLDIASIQLAGMAVTQAINDIPRPYRRGLRIAHYRLASVRLAQRWTNLLLGRFNGEGINRLENEPRRQGP
jgi:hypothetical protein